MIKRYYINNENETIREITNDDLLTIKINEYNYNNDYIECMQLYDFDFDKFINKIIHFYCENDVYFECDFVFIIDMLNELKQMFNKNENKYNNNYCIVLYDKMICIYFLKNNKLYHNYFRINI